MWKTEKNNQQFAPPQPDRGNGSHDDVKVTDPAWPDTAGSATLDDLRGQPGFGVVVSASDLQPAAPIGVVPTAGPSIGQRMSAELDTLSRRDRQVREMKELATHRVVDLTTDQLRRILEFMV